MDYSKKILGILFIAAFIIKYTGAINCIDRYGNDQICLCKFYQIKNIMLRLRPLSNV